MDALSLATDGIICTGDITQINRYILPLDLKLETNIIELNLESVENIKLNLESVETIKLNLESLEPIKLNLEYSETIKLNLKLREE